MHHADPLGVYQPHRVGMMFEWRPGELFTKTEFMHHANKGYTSLENYATLKGLKGFLPDSAVSQF